MRAAVFLFAFAACAVESSGAAQAEAGAMSLRVVEAHLGALRDRDPGKFLGTLSQQVLVVSPNGPRGGRRLSREMVLRGESALSIGAGKVRAIDCKPRGDATVNCQISFEGTGNGGFVAQREFTVADGVISKIVEKSFKRVDHG